MRPLALVALILITLAPAPLVAQRPDSLAADVRQYTAVDTAVVALTHVLLVDGTGAPPKPDQTVVIRDGRIALVGPAAAVQVPPDARSMDLSGSTVIPGIVGMHDHLFYTAAGGRAVQMSYTGPRLYLGSGVTTIRTTGGRAPYAEINLKDQIDRGLTPGPRIHLTAPYITGPQGGGSMAVVSSPEAAKRFVAYWASEGATWIKAYADIRRAELGAAIAEAHKRGIKVTGHLCSVSFQAAVALGIDSTGHGPVTQQGLQGAMAFERAFVDAGGLLAAGVDPTGIGGALAGFGDQRNYELFIEAGFTPAQAVRILTANGAKILGVDKRLGTVEGGKLADLVVLRGDLAAEPSVIRNVTLVFKDGVGYDSAKLIGSVQGRVGVN